MPGPAAFRQERLGISEFFDVRKLPSRHLASAGGAIAPQVYNCPGKEGSARDVAELQRSLHRRAIAGVANGALLEQHAVGAKHKDAPPRSQVVRRHRRCAETIELRPFLKNRHAIIARVKKVPKLFFPDTALVGSLLVPFLRTCCEQRA